MPKPAEENLNLYIPFFPLSVLCPIDDLRKKRVPTYNACRSGRASDPAPVFRHCPVLPEFHYCSHGLSWKVQLLKRTSKWVLKKDALVFCRPRSLKIKSVTLEPRYNKIAERPASRGCPTPGAVVSAAIDSIRT